MFMMIVIGQQIIAVQKWRISMQFRKVKLPKIEAISTPSQETQSLTNKMTHG